MTYKDKDKQREYNQKYLETNYQRVRDLMAAKENCQLCGRIVSHQNMLKHTTTNYYDSMQVRF